MTTYKDVAIGIQARVASQRFREKVFGRLSNGISVIESCLNNAFGAKDLIESKDSNVRVSIYLLVPVDEDKIWQEKVEHYNYEYKTNLEFILGHPTNVFERYRTLQIFKNPDFIVRLTGDCPFVSPHYISECLKHAITGYHDYISNVYPEIRTAPDGTDVEVISNALMRWAIVKEKHMTDYQKEHVTPKLRDTPPDWASIAHVGSTRLDYSDIKYSVDTREDLHRLNEMIESTMRKIDLSGSKGIKYYEI
jgi:spore coat polysaccharide biosynthesis protein SpsF (cytidylyltransferase family)